MERGVERLVSYDQVGEVGSERGEEGGDEVAFSFTTWQFIPASVV